MIYSPGPKSSPGETEVNTNLKCIIVKVFDNLAFLRQVQNVIIYLKHQLKNEMLRRVCKISTQP